MVVCVHNPRNIWPHRRANEQVLIIHDGAKHHRHRLNSEALFIHGLARLASSRRLQDGKRHRNETKARRNKKKKKALMFGSVIKGRQKQEVLEEITTASTFNLPTFKCLIHAVCDISSLCSRLCCVTMCEFLVPFYSLPPLCPYKENIHSSLSTTQ